MHHGSKTYALAVGQKAGERLEIQNNLMKEESQQHLMKAGIAEGKIVVDIGCGNGTMTAYVAKTVGSSGHVYAIDVSKEQLDLAKKKMEQKNLNNVTFLVSDINSLDNFPVEKADIVYARFVLMHLKNPEEAIMNMKALLKPGGVIASQESIMSTCYSNYESHIFKDYTDTVIALGNYLGVNYNIGDRLKGIYQNQGFSKVESYFLQNKISAKDCRQFLLLGLSEWKNKAIEAKLINEEKADLFEATIKSIPENDESLYFEMARQAYILAWNSD